MLRWSFFCPLRYKIAVEKVEIRPTKKSCTLTIHTKSNIQKDNHSFPEGGKIRHMNTCRRHYGTARFSRISFTSDRSTARDRKSESISNSSESNERWAKRKGNSSKKFRFMWPIKCSPATTFSPSFDIARKTLDARPTMDLLMKITFVT